METDRIEELIVEGTEGLFEDAEFRIALHVTLRIATEFCEFLLTHGEKPPIKEVTWNMDTIRSGMDQLFSLANICRLTETGSAIQKIDSYLGGSGPELREAFLNHFHQLAASDTNAFQRLALLLALGRLELLFLPQNFFWVLLEEV